MMGLLNAACPRCGAAFRCGAADAACDCFDLTLSAKLQAEIAAQWQDCLCVACLKQLSSADQAAPRACSDAK